MLQSDSLELGQTEVLLILKRVPIREHASPSVLFPQHRSEHRCRYWWQHLQVLQSPGKQFFKADSWTDWKERSSHFKLLHMPRMDARWSHYYMYWL